MFLTNPEQVQDLGSEILIICIKTKFWETLFDVLSVFIGIWEA